MAFLNFFENYSLCRAANLTDDMNSDLHSAGE